MDQSGSCLTANAARKAVIPIVGLLGGLIVGAAWTAMWGASEIDAVRIVVKAGLVGSFLGMAAAIVAAARTRTSLTTIRGLLWLIGLAAIVLFLLVSIP
jgi:hypothetical protein